METVIPDSPEFKELSNAWRADALKKMIGWLWDGYDLLIKEIIDFVDWSLAKDDLEREITQLLEIRIRRSMPAETFCYIQHEPKERETRKPSPAQPPEYDLAFILYSNERIMWPIEAKVLENDRNVSEYVKDVKNEFLLCRYAPFSNSGALIGYLLSGDPLVAFESVSKGIGETLKSQPDFPFRYYRVSKHKRTVPKSKAYPQNFECHHMMMKMCQ